MERHRRRLLRVEPLERRDLLNVAPIAYDQSPECRHDYYLSGVAGGYDPDYYDRLSATLVSGPQHGEYFSFDPGSGWFFYMPADKFVGSDQFTFKLNDGHEDSNVATVSINVTNQLPEAVDQVLNMTHDRMLSGVAYGTDADGDSMRASVVSGPQHGQFLNFDPGSGWFYYMPNPHYLGTDQFTYRTNDGIGNSNVATVTINVLDQAPVASDFGMQVTHSRFIQGSVSWYATDPDQDNMTAAVISGPSHASFFTFDPGTGYFSYISEDPFIGNDSFTYQLNDGILASNIATVTMTVTNENPVFAPQQFGVYQSEDQDIPADGALFSNGQPLGQIQATDMDGDSLRYTMDANDYFSVDRYTGTITISNPAALEQAAISGATITVPVHVTDGIATVNDQFTACISSVTGIGTRYIDITTANGDHYTPGSGDALLADLRTIRDNGDSIVTLIIKGHGWDDYVNTGPDAGDALMCDNGAITINGQQATALLQAVTGPGTTIKLRGCFTKPLARNVREALGNGTQATGALRFTINIPGTPWALGVYQ